MPYRPLGNIGNTIGTGTEVLRAEQIVGGLFFGQEFVVGGGAQGVIRSADYVPGVSGWAIFGDGNAEFNDVTVRGDIVSANWNGANPTDVPDVTATAGFYLDSSLGAAQFEGDLFIGGDTVITGGLTVSGAVNFSVTGLLKWTPDGATTPIDGFIESAWSGATGSYWLLGFPYDDNVLNTSAANFAQLSYTEADTVGGFLVYRAGKHTFHSVRAAGTVVERFVIEPDGDVYFKDNSGTTRFRIEENANGDIIWYASGSGIAFMWDESAKALLANDQVEGPVEIFPKGTLFTMDTAVDVADQTTTTSEVIYDTQTIGGLAANATVYVDVTITVLWKSMAAGESVACGVAINGSRRGDLAWYGTPGTTGSGGTGLTDNDATGSSSSTTGNTQPDVSGNSGGASAGTAHTHTAGTYTTTPGGGHNHLMTHTHSHTHAGPSHTHGGASPGYVTLTTRYAGAFTANASGQVTVGVSAVSTSGGGIMETTTIAYAIWRR